MNNQTASMVRAYLRRLPDEDRTFLHTRLRERFGGDVGSAVIVMQKDAHIDRWLSTARSANELYDMVDIVAQYLECGPMRS